MRTNIDLDDDLLSRASRLSNAPTKRALVREALAEYVTAREMEQRRQSYRERVLEIRKMTAKVRLSSDSRDLVRKDRESR